MNRVIYVIILLIISKSIEAGEYDTHIFDKNIHTLKVTVEGNERSYPAIELNSDMRVSIRFDDFDVESKDFKYQVVHCNYDWTKSELFADEYIQGFAVNSVDDYEYSTNTRIAYVNYNIVLPNDDVQFLVSGNYVVKVFDTEDEDIPVLTARFQVFEPLVNISTEVKKPMGAVNANSGQEIRMTVNHEQISVNDPFNDIKVVVNQNNRPDILLKEIKPVFVKNDEIVYSFSGDNILPGGNEFHTFSFTDIHRPGLQNNDIKFVDSIYHIQLRMDERRSSKRYFPEEDMNGNYIIYVDNSDDAYRSADYAYVYFYLQIEEPLMDGYIYIDGAMVNWELTEANRMHYNEKSGIYEGVLLLKQGYYDYTYTFKRTYDNSIDGAIVEGSHYETENDYLISIYLRDRDMNYDRIVGYKVINSVH